MADVPGPDVRDFSPSSPTAVPPPVHVNFDLEDGQPRPPTASSPPNTSNGQPRRSTSIQSDPEIGIVPSPTMLRRRTRANTTKSMAAVDFIPLRPHWQAGQEPGLDPSKPNGGRAQTPTFHEECQITVVDFSEEDMCMYELDNAQLIQFVKMKQENWVKCRWINVNGLSWDVIQSLGQYKKLHRLAIEDMINTSNRTKADWLVAVVFFQPPSPY